MMTPEKHELAIRYLMERLPPEDQQELKALLGEEDMPDIAEDALHGRNGITMDRLPPRLQRQAAARVRPDQSAAAENFAKRYPGAAVRVL